MAKYKKVETKKVSKVGKFEMVRETWEESDDGSHKVRMKPPVKITVKK